MIDVTDIVIATIGILAAFVTVKLIPLIKSKIGEKQFFQMLQMADVFVRAAEQLYPIISGSDEKTGPIKFDYAFAELKKFLEARGIKFSDAEIKAAIESAVKELGQSIIYATD